MASSKNNYTALLFAFLVIFAGIQEGDSFYVPGAATSLAFGTAAAGTVATGLAGGAAYAVGRRGANRFLSRRPGGFRDRYFG